MTEDDDTAYLSPKDLVMDQITELYQAGYLTLEVAKDLALRFAGEISHRVFLKKLHHKEKK